MKNIHATRENFNTRIEAEARSRELEQSSFGRKMLSTGATDSQTEEHVVGHKNIGERIMSWGKHDAFWGGLWGMLFGSALFVVGSALFVLPDIGPLHVLGPLVGWVVGILGAAVVIGGLSTLVAALVATRSEAALNSDKISL
jgi:hypothetical protein